MHKLIYTTLSVLILSVTSVGTFSKKSDTQKKIIRQGGFDIEFSVLLKTSSSFSAGKTYYWYKSGKIHQSQSGSGGLLLHSEFMKHYRSNQLAEFGSFDHGLKHGIWKKWYENGNLQLIEEWKKGVRDGIYITFDSVGKKLNKGYYKNNYKSGQWINYTNRDTVSYSEGKIKVADPNKKESFFKRIFKKKQEKKDIIKNTKEKNKNSFKSKNTKQKKDSFFKRLFKKKNKGKKKS